MIKTQPQKIFGKESIEETLEKRAIGSFQWQNIPTPSKKTSKMVSSRLIDYYLLDQGKEELRFFSGFFYQEMNFFTSSSYPGHMPETGNQQTQREGAEYPTEKPVL